MTKPTFSILVDTEENTNLAIQQLTQIALEEGIITQEVITQEMGTREILTQQIIPVVILIQRSQNYIYLINHLIGRIKFGKKAKQIVF